jgi:hypothetical protein
MDTAKRAIVFGELGRTQRKIARSGSLYLAFGVREYGAACDRRVYIFDHPSLIEEVERLRPGTRLALSGRWWLPDGQREPSLIADNVLHSCSRPMRRSRRTATAEVAEEQSRRDGELLLFDVPKEGHAR